MQSNVARYMDAAPWPVKYLADVEDVSPNSTPAVRASIEYVERLREREREAWLRAVAAESQKRGAG
jgi:hypothetical protein